MNGKALGCLVLLGILGGCREERFDPPSVSVVSPAVFPAYEAPRLTIDGASFFPVMGISTSNAQAVVGSDTFQVHLIPVAALDPACAPQVLDLLDVGWESASRVSGTLPSGGCAGVYRVEVEDPRGGRSVEAVTVTLSPLWPDHLTVVPGGCSEDAGSGGEVVQVVGDSTAYSVRVVGPKGEPASAIPSGLQLGVPAQVPVRVWMEAEDGLVDATVVSSSLASVAPSDGVLAELSGTLDARGCADLFLKAEAPGRLELSASEEALPRRGQTGVPSLDLLLQPGEEFQLRVDVPTEVTAGTAFDLTVRAAHPSTGTTVASVAACVSIEANDQDIELLPSLTSASFSCPPGFLPFTGGVWSGQAILEEVRSAAYLGVATQYGIIGLSPIFSVSPGDGARLDVEVPAAVIAGKAFVATVRVTDAWQNPVPVLPSDLDEVADLGGTVACAPLGDAGPAAEVFLDCILTRVVEPNVVSVSWQGGRLVGESAPFSTSSGSVAALSLTPPAEGFVAGQAALVKVVALDTWGNLAADATGSVMFALSSGAEVEASPVVLRGGELESLVTITRAADVDVLSANWTLWADETEISIHSGALAGLSVSGADKPVLQAGDPLPLHLRAQDNWGNAVKEYGPVVELILTNPEDEALGSLPDVSFQDGEADVTVTLTKASANEAPFTLIIRDPATGASGELVGVQVKAGPFASFVIQQAEPAYFVGQPFSLELRAIDAYQNTVLDFDRQVEYHDGTGTVWPALSGAFENGVRRERFRISAVYNSNAITVHLSGEGGDEAEEALGPWSSEPFFVLDDCVGGMQAAFTWPELDSQRNTVCRPSRVGVAKVTASASVSPSGRYTYVWSDGLGHESWTLGPSATLSYDLNGHYLPSVLVFDPTRLCGIEARGEIFVGVDDGGPVGPLVLSADKSVIYAGLADGSERANLDVSGLTCSGDIPSRPAELTVISSYGEVRGVDIAPGRPGLQTPLDPTGHATFSLSVGNMQQATVATVVAGTSDGSAMGHLSLPVENDILAPWVVDYGPSGDIDGYVSSAYVQFSEPMLPESILYNDFFVVSLEGEGGQQVLTRDVDYHLVMDPSRTVLTLHFLPEGVGVDAGAGLLKVLLPSEDGGYSVEDANGKRLDGNWDGVYDPSDSFQFSFGQTADRLIPEVISCQPSVLTYTPSAYAAAEEPGVEIKLVLKDETSLQLWKLEVYDLEENPVYEKYGLVKTQPIDSLSALWYGRDMEGPVVPNGTYWYDVTAFDAGGNRSQRPCQGWVEITNPLDLPTTGAVAAGALQ